MTYTLKRKLAKGVYELTLQTVSGAQHSDSVRQKPTVR